ncbi:MAG: hypothetical protein ACI9OU_001194, partial [Candidatus Promineifilaceae bacterium]
DPETNNIVYMVHLRHRTASGLHEWQPRGTTGHTNLLVADLFPDTVYDVRIIATDGLLQSDPLIVENAFRTAAPDINHPPTPPVHLVVSEVGQTQARLQWDPSTDPETNNIVYVVHVRARVPTYEPHIIVAEWQPKGHTGDPHLLVTGLFPDTVYDVRIVATDGRLESHPLIVENAFRTKPRETPPPGEPGQLTVTNITDRGALLMWTPAPTTGDVVIAYNVELFGYFNNLTLAESWRVVGETTNLHFLLERLHPATRYTARIRAWAHATASPYHTLPEAFITSPSTNNTPPRMPGAIKVVEVGTNRAHFAWLPSEDKDGDGINYQLSLRQVIPGHTNHWMAPENTQHTGHTVTGLMPDTLYEARVRAGDGHAFSEWRFLENPFRTRPMHPVIIPPPHNIWADPAGVHDAHIHWTPVLLPEGMRVVYAAEIRPSAPSPSGTSTWHIIALTPEPLTIARNLQRSTSYDLRVRAFIHDITSDYLVRENAFTTLAGDGGPPPAPHEFKVSDITASGARVWWNSPDANGRGLSYFASLRPTNGDGNWYPSTQTSVNTIRWEDLTPGTPYDVRVRAWDGNLYSGWFTQEELFRTRPIGDTTPPAPHHIVASNITATAVTLLWQPVRTNGAVYEVQLRCRPDWHVGGEWVPQGRTTNSVMEIAGLTPRKVYDARVRTWLGAHHSEWETRLLAFRTLHLVDDIGTGESPEPAELQVERTDREFIFVFPNEDGVNYILEEGDTLGDWEESEDPLETQGGMSRASVQGDGRTRFFRVRRRNN